MKITSQIFPHFIGRSISTGHVAIYPQGLNPNLTSASPPLRLAFPRLLYLCAGHGLNQLKQNTTIQKFITILLLLVFTISVAPRSFFHDLVADHRDTPGCSIDHKISVIHKQSFNCHFEDLVVSSPFVLQKQFLSHPPVLRFHQKNTSYQFSYYPSVIRNKENRGPPVS
jgi:hypothetical protein